mgnify:FL=1
MELYNEELFFKCIKAGFGQRRKTLLNSLSQLNDFSKDEIRKALESAGVDEKRRAETLSLDEFAAVSNTLYKGEKRE